MPTRFSYTISREKLKRSFNLNIKENELQYSYNIGAGQNAYIQTAEHNQLQIARWGFLPDWAKEESVGLNFALAMGESAAGQHSFRMAIRQQRCLVFADSYYEWKRQGRQNQPYRIAFDDGAIIAFAGVWNDWTNANGKIIRSFAIVTTQANADTQPFGARMPVLLTTTQAQTAWLQESNFFEALTLLKPLPDGLLRAYAVDKSLEDLANNSPELHLPVEPSL